MSNSYKRKVTTELTAPTAESISETLDSAIPHGFKIMSLIHEDKSQFNHFYKGIAHDDSIFKGFRWVLNLYEYISATFMNKLGVDLKLDAYKPGSIANETVKLYNRILQNLVYNFHAFVAAFFGIIALITDTELLKYLSRLLKDYPS